MCLCLTFYGSVTYIYAVQLCIGFVGGFDFPQYPSPTGSRFPNHCQFWSSVALFNRPEGEEDQKRGL